jgi:uncharacterized glyoxalase superfamily metalloenzyme YdcJ
MQAQLPLWQLRAEFAVRLAALYGAEVPAYNTLVEVSKEVNSDFVKANGADAERLGSIERVTAERHGAIRVGSPTELAQVARIFAGFGMHAVGFYDLRDASKSSVPVVSTRFAPSKLTSSPGTPSVSSPRCSSATTHVLRRGDTGPTGSLYLPASALQS